MATPAELESQLAVLEGTNLAELTQRTEELKNRYEELKKASLSTNFKLPEQYNDFLAARSRASEAKQNLETSEANLSDLNLQISNIKTEINATKDQGPKTNSAGQTQQESQTANDDGANSQKPSADPQVLSPAGRIENQPATTLATNAEKFEPNTDEGVDQAVRPITQSQATPPASQQDDAAPSASQQPGTGAPSDDNPAPKNNQAGNATQAAIDKKYAQPIIPQANILDQYASVSYTISIYLCSGPDYQRLIEGKQKYLPGFQLLIQSGGAPLDSGDVPGTTISSDRGDAPPNGPSLTQGRNKYFDLDFYIDSLRLTHILPGKGSSGSHNVTEMDFKLIEPNGMSLFQRLYRAVQEYVTIGGGGGYTGPINYADANFLMVIRWYGYDQNGKMIKPRRTKDNETVATDPLAVSEKFIPFRFKNITFRVQNRLVEYDCKAVATSQEVAQTQGRGTIPYNIEITATTLKNLLNGNLVTTPDPGQPPQKANAAPQKTAIQAGLAAALNKFTKEQYDSGKIGVPDQYEFVIVEPELANAKLRPPGQAEKGSWGMIQPVTAAQAKDGKKQTGNANSKNVSATAGMSIMQFLDLAVRNTTYIYDQQTKVIQGNEQIPQGSAQFPAWFNITTQAVPLEYDPIRNMFAQKITYQITMYRVPRIISDYFPEGKFYGTHKLYNYWFTGQNTSILRFEQEFNYQYFLTINADNASVSNVGSTNDYREVIKKFYSPNSAQSSQGNTGNANEPGANAADYLYSPGDQAEVRFEIVGDPAWIMQGALTYGVLGPDVTDPTQVNFLSDGTINYTSQDVLFEIGWNAPADYDISTGLMPIDRYKQ